MKLQISVFILLVGTVLSADAQIVDKNLNPGSLWSDNVVNPFTDRTARRVGDLLTIVISEQSAATFNASTQTSKNDSTEVETGVKLNNFLDGLLKPLTNSSSSKTSGTGTTLQNGQVSARMTVVVKQVLPNGTLAVEGTRTVLVNKELQTFKISGLVRTDDIRPDNTVLSQHIAEADIRLEGKGAIHDRQRRGLLTRLLDWLF